MSVVMMAGTPPENTSPHFRAPDSHIAELSEDYSTRLYVLKSNNQIKWLQTILRNVNTQHGDFVFNADRLVNHFLTFVYFFSVLKSLLLNFCFRFG